MKFTIAPAIIACLADFVNKNFHYVPRGGALVQITPKLSGGIMVTSKFSGGVYYYYSLPSIIILYHRSKSKSR